jgi:hypothetical protein
MFEGSWYFSQKLEKFSMNRNLIHQVEGNKAQRTRGSCIWTFHRRCNFTYGRDLQGELGEKYFLYPRTLT